MHARHCVVSLLALLLAGGSAQAQEILLDYQSNGSTVILDSVVDIDGDGTTDLLSLGAVGAVEQISILSGSTGVPLLELIEPLANQDFFGIFDGCFIDDIDGDFWPDFVIITTPFQLFFFSSQSGAQIDTLNLPTAGPLLLGATAERIPDVDGDQLDDLLVLQTAFSGLGLYVVSAGTRNVPWGRVESTIAITACSIPDQNLDGVDDILLPDASLSDALILSGVDGAFLGLLDPGVSTNIQDLKRIDDFDGDGVDDILTGPALQIFSGADLRELADIDLDLPTRLGYSLVEFEQDVNGDGVNDYGFSAIELGSSGRQLDTVFLISGRTQGLLDRDLNPSGRLGSIAGAGDLNHDGLADIIETADDGSGPELRVRAGREIYFHSSDPSPSAGTSLVLRLSEGLPGDFAAVVIESINGAPTARLYALAPLDSDGALIDRPTVPPGLAGLVVEFVGYSQWPDGRVRKSDPEQLSLR